MFFPLFLPPVWLVPVIYVLLGGLGALIVSVLISSFLPGDAASIAILGSQGAGKSTLWQQLQGILTDESYHPTLAEENINQFTINYDGKKKVIEKSKDFSGSHDVVKDYGEIIKEGTFIYYLVDITTLEAKKRETRARLKKIGEIIEKKKLKDKVGLRLVATHFKEYIKNNPDKDINNARAELMSVIGLRDLKDVTIEDVVMVAELTDKKDIRQFFEQIVK